MAQPKVACQLIIFGKEAIQKDLPGVFKTLSDAGYHGAEVGYLGDQIDGAGLKKLLDDNDLFNAGIHGGFAFYTDRTAEMIDYAKASGAGHLICSGVGDKDKLESYEAAADVFNRAGEECQKAGLRFCYHNHSWEFKDFEGVTGLSRLYERTNPELVQLCVDTYWVKHGGDDPAAFLKRYLNRLELVHFKDMKATPEMKDGKEYPFAEVGEGILDWQGIMEVVLNAGLAWVTVEQDRTTGSAAESVKISRDYLKSQFGL